MDDLSDDELLAELGVGAEPVKLGSRTPREERIIAGFEEIVRFVEQYGRAPQHGEERDIFERLYAVRLDRFRELTEARELLSSLDTHGLLESARHEPTINVDQLDDDALIDALGATEKVDGDISVLRHIASREERKAADEIANREPCKDFARFKPLFELVDSDLKSGARQTRPFGKNASIAKGDFFVLGGQTVYVAELGELFRTSNGDMDARLRAVYSNGTESNLLLRSLQRALYKDNAGRRLTDPSPGPLFAESWEEDELQSGTIYVLRSKSDHPFVTAHRELIHKIGVTGGSVEARIAGAVHDATYLLGEVEIVATYKLADINRTKLEALFHRLFAAAKLDITIHDRFGVPVRPQEWFLVPLAVINEAVERVRDGSIAQMSYDPTQAKLVVV